MASILLATAQAGSVAPIDFDLRTLATKRGCDSPDSTDILVCGRRSTADRQRLPVQPERYPVSPPVAEVALPNGWKANLHAESQDLPGATSKRAMVSLKIPF